MVIEQKKKEDPKFIPNRRDVKLSEETKRKISISQKNIALTLDELETEGILTSKKEGNMKFFSLNIRNPIVKDVIIQTELSKKIYFLVRLQW